MNTDEKIVKINGKPTNIVTLAKDKETKNTVRFTTQDGLVTGSLYVSKDDARAKQDTITLLVEA